MKTRAVTAFLATLSLCSLQASADQTGAPANSTGQCPPPGVVAAFLGIDTKTLGDLVSEYVTNLHGLQEQITARQNQLNALLSQPNADPAAVGTDVLQIQALHQEVAQVTKSFQTRFLSLLTDEQKQKVQSVTQASQLQGVAGAFVALNLVAAPKPLPCQMQ